MQKNTAPINFIFFGTSRFSVLVLDALKAAGYVPSLLITGEDKPKGRKLIMTPPETKTWAIENHVPFLQLKSLKGDDVLQTITAANGPFDLAIVASYGKIIPQHILDIPKKGTLNVHPSMLPLLRGASPIQSAILTLDETGVSIMHLDAEMDHGPIIAQKKIETPEWPPYEKDLEEIAAREGGVLLASLLPEWVAGTQTEMEQDHSAATFCKKIQKTDGEINLSDPADTNLRKIRAFHIWPGAYYFHTHKDKVIRVIIKSAHTENNTLVLERVVPEGKKEMDYADFLRGLH